MKKISFYLSVIFTASVLFYCNKSNDTKPAFNLSPESSPSAKASDNTKSSGVYKGTFLGSTGTFKLVLDATGIYGYLQVDYEKYILSTKDIATNDLGNKISNALFTDGTNKVKVYFSVEADGSNPSVTINIEGHPDIQAVVLKETSEQQVLVYEGYFSTADSANNVQTIANLNLILLQNDTVGQATYRVVNEVPIVSGATHETPANWDGSIVYYLEQSGSENTIRAYHIQNNNFYWYFFDYSRNAKITDSEIGFKVMRSLQGVSYYDSAKLTRKL